MVYGRSLGPEEAMLRVCHAIRYFGSPRYGQDMGMTVKVVMTSLHFASLTAFRGNGKWSISHSLCFRQRSIGPHRFARTS